MKVSIKQAGQNDSEIISSFVKKLLLELSPDKGDKINNCDYLSITEGLFKKGKIFAFIAYDDSSPIGIITMHECAAVYAQGVFGEISELYVTPRYRSQNIGTQLLYSSIELAKASNWKRLEVGAPNANQWSRTIGFYKSNGFSEIGPRLSLGIEKALTKKC